MCGELAGTKQTAEILPWWRKVGNITAEGPSEEGEQVPRPRLPWLVLSAGGTDQQDRPGCDERGLGVP